MLSERESKTLLDIYFLIRDVPYWIGYCRDAGYTNEEIIFLEKCGDEFGGVQPEEEAEKAFADIEKEGGIEVYDCENVDEKIKILSKKISEIYDELAALISRDVSYLDRHIFITQTNLKRYEKLRNGLRSKIIFNPKTRGQLSESEILKAREIPLSFVVGDAKRIPCPFHQGEDKNFSIHGRYGYCFVCGQWCDAIKWVMTFERKSFVEAVKSLN